MSIDYSITVAPVKGLDIYWATSEQSVFKLICWMQKTLTPVIRMWATLTRTNWVSTPKQHAVWHVLDIQLLVTTKSALKKNNWWAIYIKWMAGTYGSITMGQRALYIWDVKKLSFCKHEDVQGNILLGNFDPMTFLKISGSRISGSKISVSRIMRPVTLQIVQEWLEELDKGFKLLTLPQKFQVLNLWEVLNKQVWSFVPPHCNLKDLKDLLLMHWCQIPQYTFRGLVEFIAQWVSIVLMASG